MQDLSAAEQIHEFFLDSGSVEQDSAVREVAEGSVTRVVEEVLIPRRSARAGLIQAEAEPVWRSRAPRRLPPGARLQNYRELVSRTVEVFGDESKASRWLSIPSTDLDGRTPLDVAQSVDYDESQLQRVFEPIFTRIEHGIYR